MFKLLTILLTILSTSSFACERVSRVIDGDTIVMEDGKIVRILGIDAYDKNSRMARKQFVRTGYNFSISEIKQMAELATNEAKKLLENKCVNIEKDYKDKGIFKRYLRYVEVDGQDYQEIMLKKGLANVYCEDKKIKRFNQYLLISEFKC